MNNDLNEHVSYEKDSSERTPHERRGRGQRGAKTFRRGRALAFYEKLLVKRDTLKQQLESPEFQSIQPVIAGELKATEAIMNAFKADFELDEISQNVCEKKD